MRCYLMPVAAIVLLFALAIWAAAYQLKQEQACEDRGGEPLNLRGKVVCLEKGIMK
jgi:hypothetical protein